MHKKSETASTYGFASRKGTSQNLQSGLEESLDFIERNDIYLVIQVRMAGMRNNQQFLVVADEFFEGVFAEVARMGLFTVDEKHRVAYLARVGQQRHIHKREGRGGIPRSVGIDGTGMEAALGFVVVKVILDELRFISLKGGGQPCL